MSHRRKHRLKLKSLYVWHRYIGLAAAVLIVLLALTGIPLNHTERLELESRFVRNDWLLDWYGIVAPDEYKSYATALGSVTLLDSRLYVKETPVAGEYHQLQGAIESNGMLVVAVDSSLLLFTADSALIDRLTASGGLPDEILRLGVTADGELVIDTGTRILQAEAGLMRWAPRHEQTNDLKWSEPAQLNENERSSLAAHYRGEILPYERVLLDVHSGRIFGRYGPWVMDAAALLMMFLAVTGVVMWLKRKR